jgi:hypothetical protein
MTQPKQSRAPQVCHRILLLKSDGFPTRPSGSKIRVWKKCSVDGSEQMFMLLRIVVLLSKASDHRRCTRDSSVAGAQASRGWSGEAHGPPTCDVLSAIARRACSSDSAGARARSPPRRALARCLAAAARYGFTNMIHTQPERWRQRGVGWRWASALVLLVHYPCHQCHRVALSHWCTA